MDWPVLAGGTVLVAAAFAAYCRTFSVPLIYDDVPSIVDNPTLRHLGSAFWPPASSTVSGRPILNLSLAVNFAVSGTAVGSYHAANLAIHALSGLVLFGIVRRTLSPRVGQAASTMAFCAALLWILHPLQTESVTYVVQRAESLMGLFYLLTLYCFIRGAITATPGKNPWYPLSVAACFLGMGTKEVMVSAPLIVLLYDRTFLAGSFAGAWRRRRLLYSGLAASWLFLLFLVLSTHGRAGTAGFGSGISWWSYALTQVQAIALYLRLCFWPRPLVFDYGISLASLSVRILPSAIAIGGLMVATVWALIRKPAAGFLGAGFFAVLAPSSSIVPVVTETIAEHRMYLALAPVAVLVVVLIYRWTARAALPLCMALAAGLFCATWQRNETYRSEEEIWSDTVAKQPGNDRAQNNLGNMLAKDPSRLNEAVSHFEEALRLSPGYADAHYNLGITLSQIPGRSGEAIAQYEEVLRLRPDYVEAHNNLGIALGSLGRTKEAIGQFQEALRLDPNHGEAHYNMGNALSSMGRPREAIAQFQEALRLDPGHFEAHNNLANALVSVGTTAEAISEYENALHLRPGYAEAHYNLGNALSSLGRTPEAVSQFEEAIRLKPDFTEAHYNLGNTLSALGRTTEAITQFEATLRLDPNFVEAHNNLGCDLEKLPGRLNEAIAQFEETLRLKPDHVEAHYNLGSALQKIPGRLDEAIAQYEEALRLEPDYFLAHYNLGNALSSQGRLNEAVAQYKEALLLQPDSVPAHCNLGIALKSLGRIPEAISQYEDALRLSPNDVAVHLNFAVALLRVTGRTDEAIGHLRDVLRLQPDNAAAAQILARIDQLKR